MRNLIIGVIDNYTYDKIEPWVVSLERTEYEGAKVLLAYNISKKTADRLEAKGVIVFAFQKDEKGNLTYPKLPGFSIMVERFAHIWYFLTNSEEKFDKVIVTDVADVIFQNDPFENPNIKSLHRECIVGSENICYRDEPWSKNNMIRSFGNVLYETVKDNPIFCAGVFGGNSEALRDFCMNIFLICKGADSHIQGGGGPDQAAMNILLSMDAYKTSVKRTHGAFVVHAGTSMQAIHAGSGGAGQVYKDNPSLYQNLLIWPDEMNITMREDGCIYMNGEKIDIVHQYNRVPLWDQTIRAKYKE